MKKLYSKFLFSLVAICLSAVTTKAQSPVNAGPDIYLPCGINCTNIPVSLLNSPSVATNTYAVSSIPFSGNFGPFNAGTNYNLTTDDYFGSLVNLPFTFCFYGQNFNTCVIGSNGIISFTSAPNSFLTWIVNNPIPSGNYPNYSIMGDYCDLYPHAVDKIKYLTTGVAPNRKFVVNYNVIDYFFSTPSATFQIVLHETTNIVEVYIQYAPNLAGGGVAICGIQQNNAVALAAPGRNSGAWSVQNTIPSPSEAWRWTPTGGVSGGAPLSVTLTTLLGLPVQVGVVVPSPPNYAATFTNICPTTDTSDYVVEAVYVTCAGPTTFKDTVRIIKTATPPPTVTSPVIACQYSSPGPLQATGTNLLWYQQAVGGIGSSVAPPINTTLVGPDTVWVSQTLNGCESIRVPIYITINPTPVVTASSNSPVCQGDTIELEVNPVTTGVTYAWTGPAFVGSGAIPMIFNAQMLNAGTYTVVASQTTTVNGTPYTCTGSSTTLVQVVANPFIAFASVQQATTCTGTAQITLVGLSPNTTYTVNYTKNGVPQLPVTITSNGTGQVIITGLGPGTYTSISVSLNGCTSNTIAGPYTVNNPPVGATIAETHINPTTCGGSNGSITLTGLTNGVNYTINYTKNGTPQPPFNQVAVGGSVTIPNLTAGTYTSISVTIVTNGCVSNTIASVILVDPNATNINVTFTNPTSCNSNTGSITIAGLTNGSSYTINYVKNSTPQAPISITASGTSYTITNLGAGAYTGITVTLNGCTSNVQTATLVDPTPPAITVVGNNPTSCTVNNGSIVISGLTNGSSYTINYVKNGTAQAPVTQTASGGSVTIASLGAGNYTGITVTINGCISNAGTVTLVAPTPPVITVVGNNPTGCTNNNGTMVISGLTNGSSYTINYVKNGTTQAPITQTASGGSVTISGLGAGNYTGITVTINGCVSNILTATLVDPPGPVIAYIANNPALCAQPSGSIVLTGLTNGSSYTINYSKNGTPQAPITQTASGGSVTIANLTSGTYSNITVTINGCVSNILGPITLSDPSAPAVPVVTGNGPLCPGQTFNLTANSTTPGVTYLWSSTVNPLPFNQNTQNPTVGSIQSSQAGLYSVTASLNGCTSAAGTYTLVVNPAPVTPNAGPDLTVCEGGTINLTATTPTPNITLWQWTSNTTPPYNATGQSQTIAPATIANTGAYYVTATALGCASLPDTVNVTVVPTPAIQYTANNPSTCGGTNGSIVLNTLTNGSSYVINYSKNGVPQTAITQTATGGSVIITGLGAGTYTNITVSLNGCPSNILGPILITDPNLPPSPIATTGGSVCEGDTLFLFASTVPGANIYTWTGPGFPQPQAGQNQTITPATLAANGTYSVTATVNGCTSLPGTVLVDIKAVPPAPTVSTNAPLCEGGVLNLNSDPIPNVNYDWSGPGFSGSNEDEVINNAQVSNSGTYVLTVDNGFCSSTNSINVVVNPIPAAPVVVSPTEVCQGTTHQLTAQGQNLLWYTGPTGGVGSPTMNAVTTTATTITYYVSQTVNGCESPRAAIDIIVKPQPAPPVAQTNYVYCQYDVATQLTAAGTNLTWYDGNNIQLPGAPTPNTSVAQPLTYYVTQTDSGCESNKLQIDVLINAKPPMPTVEQLTICQDDPIPTLNVQGQNLQWYDSATGGTYTTVTPTVSTTDTGVFDFYVSQTVNNCESDRALLRVIVNPKVVAEFITDLDTVCDSYPLTVTFTGTAPSTATFDWDFDGATDVTGSGVGPYTVVWDTEGPRTITLTVTNLNCTSTFTKTIQVLPTLEPNFDLLLDACVNEEVRVQVGWDQMDLPGYQWNFGDAIVTTGVPGTPGPYTLKWNATGQHAISLSLTNIPCPSLPKFDTINIHQPIAKIESVSQGEICTSDSVLFTALPGLDQTYQWTPNAFFGDINENLSMWGTIKKTSYVTLTVTDRWGCKSADSLLVEPKSCCEVFLPNTFTPNGDGKNDVFRMVTKGNQEISAFIIMDRWGKRVFESINQYEPWDGSFNGEPQDIGTYQYYLRYRCADNNEIVEMKGDVILLR